MFCFTPQRIRRPCCCCCCCCTRTNVPMPPPPQQQQQQQQRPWHYDVRIPQYNHTPLLHNTTPPSSQPPRSPPLPPPPQTHYICRIKSPPQTHYICRIKWTPPIARSSWSTSTRGSPPPSPPLHFLSPYISLAFKFKPSPRNRSLPLTINDVKWVPSSARFAMVHLPPPPNHSAAACDTRRSGRVLPQKYRSPACVPGDDMIIQP